MEKKPIPACQPVEISDDDIYEAMKEISGYVDITPGDFKEVYRKAFQHAVNRLTRSVSVSAIMTKDVAKVTSDMPLWAVAELMAERKVSGVPVVDEYEKVLGVISNRDFLRALGGSKSRTFMKIIADCLKGGGGCLAVEVRNQCAGDFMTSPPVTSTPDTLALDIANIMARRGINRVPIVDSQGKLVGIVSRADIVNSTLVG